MLTSRIPTIVRVLAIAGISLAACTKTTTIDQAWTSPTPTPPLHNVVTMFITSNQTMRHAGEDKMAQYLQMHGIRATPSYMLLGDQKPQDVASVKALMSQMGYDGVVTQRIVDRETAVSYAPSTFDGAWGWWGGYYGAADYYWGAYTYEIYRLETEADSLFRRIMAGLFSGRYDALEILKWKDVIEAVERAINAVEEATVVIESIAVKHA